VLMAGSVILALQIWSRIANVPLTKITPTAILSWQARTTSDRRFLGEAFKELASRAQSSTISKERFSTLAAFVLERQADQSSPWVAGMGDVIEFGRITGLVGDEMWSQYVGVLSTPIESTQALRVSHQGKESLQLRCNLAGYRLGSGNLSLFSTLAVMELDGQRPNLPEGPQIGVSPVGHSTTTQLRIPLRVPQPLPSTITIEWDMVVTPTAGATAPSVRRRETLQVQDFGPMPKVPLVSENAVRSAIGVCVVRPGSNAHQVIVEIMPMATSQRIVVQVALEWHVPGSDERREMACGLLHLAPGKTAPQSYLISAPRFDPTDPRTRVVLRPVHSGSQSQAHTGEPARVFGTPQHNITLEPTR